MLLLEPSAAGRPGVVIFRRSIQCLGAEHSRCRARAAEPKLNITWDRDRSKDVESAPWFKVFQGEFVNDHHLTRAEKIVAVKRS